MNWNLSQQRERRDYLFDVHTKTSLNYFNKEGKWINKEYPAPGLRERWWHCLAFLAGNKEAIQRANAIILSSELRFCHFSPFVGLQILYKYRNYLEDKTIKKLESYIKDCLPKMQRITFSGYNDNFPAMASFTLLVAGELFKENIYLKRGLEILKGLEDLLKRRGFLSEYVSPTYTPVSLLSMAEIVNYIKSSEAQKVAQGAEERIWVEIATHFHAPSCQLTGPSSRSYAVDSVGHLGNIKILLYFVFGESVFVNPARYFYPPYPGQVIHHSGDVPFVQSHTAWFASADYHPPNYIAKILFKKSFPYEVKGTTECGPFRDWVSSPYPVIKKEAKIIPGGYEYPKGKAFLTTYMQKDYALGTSSCPFLNGDQNDSFHIVYCSQKPATRIEHSKTIFSRYIVNEKEPGQRNYYPFYHRFMDADLLTEEGRMHTLQYKNCALILYKPKQREHENIFSLKLNLLFPNHYSFVDEIWFGENKVNKFSDSAKEFKTIFVKDGPVYTAFRPLVVTQLERNKAMRIYTINHYTVISLYNYQGKPKSFAEYDLIHTGNGFIVEIAGEDELSFEEFRAKIEKSKVEDVLKERLRKVRYERDAIELSLGYDPFTEEIKEAFINGNPRPEPIFEATNFDSKSLPFISY